jgi:inner membrane protein
VLYLFYEKYEMLSIHRGYSHSILFSIVGAGLLGYFLKKMRWRVGLTYWKLFLFAWLCLFTHMLLDTFTAYGTQLYLPFSNARLGFDSINVVDAVYTVPMIVGLALSTWVYKAKPQRPIFNKWGLAISSAYLVFTLFHKSKVESSISALFEERQIEYSDLLTMPVGAANLNWYGVGKGRDSIYMVRYSAFSGVQQMVEAIPIHEEYLDEIKPEVAATMRWFAKDFYTVDKVGGKIRIYNLQVDMRGIVDMGDKKAPTHGYFEVGATGDENSFSSGTVHVLK